MTALNAPGFSAPRQIGPAAPIWLMASLLLAACQAGPQLPDPLEAGWQGKSVCTQLHETRYQRVLRCEFPPGIGHERHFHRPHTGYVLTGGRMQIVDDGGLRIVTPATGGIFASEGIAWHEVLNVGDSTAVFLIIEDLR